MAAKRRGGRRRVELRRLATVRAMRGGGDATTTRRDDVDGEHDDDFFYFTLRVFTYVCVYARAFVCVFEVKLFGAKIRVCFLLYPIWYLRALALQKDTCFKSRGFHPHFRGVGDVPSQIFHPSLPKERLDSRLVLFVQENGDEEGVEDDE